MISQPALAQQPGSEAEAVDGVQPVQSDVIVVTGTRIVRPEVQYASPVVAVSEENIVQSGETNVTELLRQTPALFNSENNFDAAGSQSRFGGAGVNLLDLRNLGPQRTLVLVNGRRHIAGVPGEAAVDINTIPLSLIERVDVLTGGVSAIYGADGVSGVVNFVMQQDFEGVDFRAQTGFSEYGDGDSSYLGATVGSNFADDRANITATYEYRYQDRVGYDDRPIGRRGAERLVRNPNDIPDDPNIPDNIFLSNLGYSDSSPAGAVVVDPSYVTAFLGSGEPFDAGQFLPESGFLAVGGDNTPIADYQGDLQAETEAHIANLFASYELSPSLRLFAEGKYVTSTAFTIAQPSFDFYNFVSAENPFIPQSIQDAIETDNFGPGTTGVLLSRDNFDLGRRNEYVDRDLYRTVVGAEGDVSSNARFEVSYVYGRNETTFTSENYRLEDRFFAALDVVTDPATGQPVCRVSLTGGDIDPINYGAPAQTFDPASGACAPLNLFGEGVTSQESLDFINVDLENEVLLQQHVVNGFISGDFGQYFELPGGPVRFAFGGEYRQEKSEYTPDPIATRTTDFDPNSGVLQDLALLGNESGEFDVVEGFAELNVPVLSDVPFAENLEFGAAVRVSEYSTIGTTTTWKVDGLYSPVRDIIVRGSYSEAVRAPNISELYAPTQGTFSFLTDPCSPLNIDRGTEFRAGNCEALLTGLGVDFDSFDFESAVEASASIEGVSQGNENLSEETATTWTAGVVLQPRFVPGFAITLDWYDIRIEDAVNTASLQQTSEFCVDSASLDNAFCNNITRDPETGYIIDYRLRPENVAFFETAGADLTMTYGFDAGRWGSISLNGTVGYLDKLKYLPANAGVVDIDRGEVGAPKWVGTGDVTWNYDLLTLNYGLNYTGKQRRFEFDETAADPDIVAPEYLYFNDVFTHDIRAEVQVDDSPLAVFAGINNFTNEKPDRGSATTPVSFLGRYFFAGIRIRTDVIPTF